MIIARTPLRVSFLGGGSDYPEYFKEHGGTVVATSIDKYSYVTVTPLSDFFDHTIRISYSKQELAREVSDIKHPVVREVLRMLEIPSHVEINCIADLPARTGLGSSSSFVVCLMHALYTYKGIFVSKEELARLAIKLEQDILKENVGSQDQVVTAIGGLQQVTFSGNNQFHSRPLIISEQRIKDFNGNLMMFYTGLQRLASEIAEEQVKRTSVNVPQINQLKALVGEGVKVLESKGNLDDFGKLLHEGWQLKKTFSKSISNPLIDEIYETAMKAGALGGKLLGAGGGGFVLMYVPKGAQPKVRTALHKFKEVDFDFENEGSSIVYYRHRSQIQSNLLAK